MNNVFGGLAENTPSLKVGDEGGGGGGGATNRDYHLSEVRWVQSKYHSE